ncbi:MAG: thiolase family protein [Myxococcaceae bacterium]
MLQNVVIASRARTPIGKFSGALSALTAVVIEAAVQRAGLAGSDLDEVIMGQVLTAGVGQAPARQAALKAEIPVSVPCTTVNKVCGSGLKAIMLAAQSIQLGDTKIAVAGGMESMSNAPYIMPKARFGYRMGHQSVLDTILQDGLLDPYSKAHMGLFGDQCAAEFEFSREQQDAFAQSSYEKALTAQKNGLFNGEIISLLIDQDEEPAGYKPEKMPNLKPAFGPTGTVTPANASKINDGAAAVVLMSEAEAQKRGIQPLTQILSMATFAQDPAHFTTAPAGAIKLALQKAGLTLGDIDFFEINEAFSVVTMACIKELNLNPKKVNIWGGAVALGHPIGCSGARLLVTLCSILQHQQGKIGCVSICLGGGEAVAMIIKRLSKDLCL